MFLLLCSLQQKKPETPLEPTNPFLEDESGEDNVSEKEEDLDRVRLLIYLFFFYHAAMTLFAPYPIYTPPIF